MNNAKFMNHGQCTARIVNTLSDFPSLGGRADVQEHSSLSRCCWLVGAIKPNRLFRTRSRARAVIIKLVTSGNQRTVSYSLGAVGPSQKRNPRTRSAAVATCRWALMQLHKATPHRHRHRHRDRHKQTPAIHSDANAGPTTKANYAIVTLVCPFPNESVGPASGARQSAYMRLVSVERTRQPACRGLCAQ